MKHSSTVDDIIRELCEMEPALAKKKAELRRVVETLVREKPADAFDPAFARRLRRQLLNQEQSFLPSFMQSLSAYRAPATYALSGALVAVVLLVPLFYRGANSLPALYKGPAGVLNTSFNNTPAFAPQSSNAFGSLATLAQAHVRDQSGGGNGNMPVPMSPMPNMTSSVAPDEKMIAPYFQPYTYVYKGEALTIKDANRDVYKRIKALDAASVNALVGQFGGGLINIGSFNSLQMRSVDFYENRDQGYGITINFTEGTVSISPNYEKWFTERTALCAKGACPEVVPIRLDQIPADAELIRIANAFLTEHGIDTSVYGAPMIDSSWRTWYDQSEDKANYYLPETYAVVYPYQLQGQDVRDSGAGIYGLRVDIHVPDNKVFSVYNLNTQQYQNSSYATEQDTARLVKAAERGGLYGWWGGEANPDAKQISLGTPTEVLMQYWRYDGLTNEELYVPALMFPVLDAPKDIYVPANVIVPIIKEILDAQEQQVIMPLRSDIMMKSSLSPMSEPAMPVPTPTMAPAPEVKQ